MVRYTLTKVDIQKLKAEWIAHLNPQGTVQILLAAIIRECMYIQVYCTFIRRAAYS